MQVFFVEQASQNSLIKALFKTIELNNDKIILNIGCQKISTKKKIKLVKQIKMILQKNKVNTVIIEQILKEDKELVNLLYSSDIQIIERKISL